MSPNTTQETPTAEFLFTYACGCMMGDNHRPDCPLSPREMHPLIQERRDGVLRATLGGLPVSYNYYYDTPPSLQAAEHKVIARVLGGAVFVVQTVAVLVLASVIFQTAFAWYRGGSLDPRCVFSRAGWVEMHDLEHGAVTCEYRPTITKMEP